MRIAESVSNSLLSYLSNILTSVLPILPIVTVLKLYDYMAVMSNVLMAQQSNPNASKISTTSVNGIGSLT